MTAHARGAAIGASRRAMRSAGIESGSAGTTDAVRVAGTGGAVVAGLDCTVKLTGATPSDRRRPLRRGRPVACRRKGQRGTLPCVPVSYQIDVERSLVIVTVTGKVSAADMFAHQQRLAADPAFSPAFDSLNDFSDTEPFTASADDIRRLAQKGPHNPGVRRAFVVSSDLHFGLSRMAATFSETAGLHVEVFRDRAAALAWLGRG